MTVSGPLYFRGANPLWYFVNVDGVPFDQTYYMNVLTNTIPYMPAPLYGTNNGTPLANPAFFLSNGTLNINNYFDPKLVYRLEFRQSTPLQPPSQADRLVYLVENFQVSEEGEPPVDLNGDFTDNQITNPQFAFVNFESPYVLVASNPPSLEIAPGWFLDLTGSGTLIVNQVPLNNAIPTPTNAPYALRITLSGSWTGSAILRQRFETNGVLWANQYVSSSMTMMVSGAPVMVAANLYDSSGGILANLQTNTLTNNFVQYLGSTLLPASTNSNEPPNAYVDLKILLPTNGDIYITSVQLVSSSFNTNVSFEQTTVNRQADQTFNYYFPQLAAKPIPSYLVGWDFGLNPMQLLGSTGGAINSGVNTSNYIWDQTIVFQNVTSAFTFDSAADGSLLLTTAEANTQLALVQYLDGNQINDLFENPTSVYFNGFCDNEVTCTISLWACLDGSLPSVSATTYKSIVKTLDANGHPDTQWGNWTEITTQLLQNNSFVLPAQSISEPTYNEEFVTGWQPNLELVGVASFFAIVVGFSALPSAANLAINAIGLNVGTIPTRPAPKTQEEVLTDCEQYFEMSYENYAAFYANTVSTTATFQDALGASGGAYITGASVSGSSANTFFAQPNITIPFRTVKNSIPTMAIYNPSTGAPNSVRAQIYSGGSNASGNLAFSTYWTPGASSANIGTKAATYVPQGNPSTITVTASTNWSGTSNVSYHYVADSRLGK